MGFFSAIGGAVAGGLGGAVGGALDSVVGGGGSIPAGGYLPGQVPGQPSPAVLGAALASGSPYVNNVRQVLARYDGQWEKGFTAAEIMTRPDVLGWLAWGGGNAAVRGDGEKQLRAAVEALLADASMTAGPGFTAIGAPPVSAGVTYQNGQVSGSVGYGDPQLRPTLSANTGTAIFALGGLVVVLLLFLAFRGGRR